MGFDNVKLKAATCIWDELVPDMYSGTTAITYGTAFFLNTKFYKLLIDRETDFTTTPFIENEQQTADSAKILFMGNASSVNQRKLGVLYRISQSIVA
jgi:subtilase family serine protease